MDKTFDFNQVPYDWTLCYVEGCSHKDECMRYQVCLIAPDSMTRNKCVLPTVSKKRECPHFMPIKKVRAAIGFQHIFDEIKAKHSHVMWMELANYLGTGGSYYRYRNGENLLMPEQQEWIKKMFLRYGYTEEVVFDNYKTIKMCIALMTDKPNVKRQCAVKKLPIVGNDFTNGWKQYYHHLVNNAILCHSSLIIAGTIKRRIFGLCFLVSQMIVMSCS